MLSQPLKKIRTGKLAVVVLVMLCIAVAGCVKLPQTVPVFSDSEFTFEKRHDEDFYCMSKPVFKSLVADGVKKSKILERLDKNE